MPATINTDNRAALVARKFVEGQTAIAIAKEFGFKTSAPISVAIKEFIFKYCPEVPRYADSHFCHRSSTGNILGGDRMLFAKKALRRWGESLDATS